MNFRNSIYAFTKLHLFFIHFFSFATLFALYMQTLWKPWKTMKIVMSFLPFLSFLLRNLFCYYYVASIIMWQVLWEQYKRQTKGFWNKKQNIMPIQKTLIYFTSEQKRVLMYLLGAHFKPLNFIVMTHIFIINTWKPYALQQLISQSVFRRSLKKIKFLYFVFLDSFQF